jgi:hypothetical protein
MAPSTTTKSGNTVVAREAIVINVGGRPAEYGKIMVTDRRTGERVEILDTDNDPIVAADEGTPHAFKSGERVSKAHPAVKECPGAFMSLEEAEGEE